MIPKPITLRVKLSYKQAIALLSQLVDEIEQTEKEHERRRQWRPRWE